MEAPSPYAPPQAAVEVEDHAPLEERPPEVGRAVILLWVGLGISSLKGIWNLFFPPPGSLGLLPGLLSLIFGLLLMAWIYKSIGKGRNWARILFLVFTGIGLVAMPFTLRFMPKGFLQPGQLIVMAINTLLQAYVAYLLLTRPVREWFRAMKRRA
jgi:hypothetical protein